MGHGGLAISVLGPLEVRRDGVPVDVTPAMVRTLLGVLALHHGEAVSLDEIVDALWGADPPATHRNLVQVYVSRLRGQLRAAAGDDDAVQVRSVRAGYRLDADPDQVDADAFRQECEQARRFDQAGDPTAAIAGYRQALARWRGPVLADLGATFAVQPAAVALGERRIAAALELGRLARATGQAEAGTEVLRAVSRVAPLHEGLHIELAYALAAGGDRAGALLVCDELRRRLADELGVGPSAQLQAVHLELLQEPEAVAPRPRAAVAVGPPVAEAGPVVPTPSAGPGPATGPARPGPEPEAAARRRRWTPAAWSAGVAGLVVVAVIGGIRLNEGPGRTATEATGPGVGAARAERPAAAEPVLRSDLEWQWVYGPVLARTATDAQWASAQVTGLTDPDGCTGFRMHVGRDPQGPDDHQGFLLAVCPTKWKIEARPEDMVDGRLPVRLPASGLLRVAVTGQGVVTIDYAGRRLAVRRLRHDYPYRGIVGAIYQATGDLALSGIRAGAAD